MSVSRSSPLHKGRFHLLSTASLPLRYWPRERDSLIARAWLSGRPGPSGLRHAHPSSFSRGSLIPKWWATSWITVFLT
jgi:hypothetical protein